MPSGSKNSVKLLDLSCMFFLLKKRIELLLPQPYLLGSALIVPASLLYSKANVNMEGLLRTSSPG